MLPQIAKVPHYINQLSEKDFSPVWCPEEDLEIQSQTSL